tara:strand:- start:960 stop:1355 length:396 start_codon:yes stop_codon:yes gene_type:complete
MALFNNIILENNMRSLVKIEKYTPEYDELMDAPLELMHGVYGYVDENKYSIKIPNELAKVTMHHSMDGDQPSYDRRAENYLREKGIEANLSLADYPRNGDTLRLFFDEEELGYVALFFLKELANKKANGTI